MPITQASSAWSPLPTAVVLVTLPSAATCTWTFTARKVLGLGEQLASFALSFVMPSSTTARSSGGGEPVTNSELPPDAGNTNGYANAPPLLLDRNVALFSASATHVFSDASLLPSAVALVTLPSAPT